MVNLNMTKEGTGQRSPGRYLVDLVSVEEKVSTKSGHPMLKVEFVTVGEDAFTVYDNIMLDGAGWGIGQAALIALGVPKDFDGEFDPMTLIGRRVWVHLDWEENQKTGKKYLAIDIKEGEYCGYDPADAGEQAGDPELTGKGAPLDLTKTDDDVPF